MITPARADLTTLRNQDFICTIELAGIDLTQLGSDIVAQVRLYAGAPVALIDFRKAGGDTDITITLLTMESGVPVSTVRLKAVEQVMKNLPRASQTSADAQFVWDLQVKAGAATENVYQTLVGGAFIVREGVTNRG